MAHCRKYSSRCWLLLGLAGCSLFLNRRKADPAETLLILGTGFMSFMTVRLIPLFFIAAAPATSRMLTSSGLLKLSRPAVLALAVLSALWYGTPELKNIRNLGSGQLVSKYLPVRAADFIQSSGIQGNLFNTYIWGGYLIWRLGPERKVFIDGRALDEDAYAAWQLIEAASPQDAGGKPYWKAALDVSSVNCIVIPLLDLRGAPLPLLAALVNDNDWSPVYLERNELVFLRNSPANSELLKSYAIPREIFLQALNEEYRRMTGSGR